MESQEDAPPPPDADPAETVEEEGEHAAATVPDPVPSTPPTAHSALSPLDDPDEPPEHPDEPDAPGAPIRFPTAEEALAAREQLQQHPPADTLVVADADGTFESVALDRADSSSPPRDGAWSNPGEPHHADSPLPTPPLSDSASTSPPESSGPGSSTAVPEQPASLVTSPPPEPAAPELGSAPTDAPPTPKPRDVEEAKRKQSGTHRGASVLQMHVSMTRQRDLPPKDKEQEKKHLRELEEMLAASREAEKRREQELETARHQRAAFLAAALPAWESSILPNWRAVLRPTSHGASLRQLWWDGSMPVRFRGQLWGQCIGNSLALGKSAWTASLARAKKGIEEGRYPLEERDALLQDVQQTLPALKLFQKDGVMHDELVDLLLAYTVYWPGPPRYPKGLSFLAALVLVNMPVADAFLSLVNLINKSFLKSFYMVQPEEEDAYYRIFDTLLADNMPKVYANFSHELVRPSLYLRPWLTTAFVHFLPLDLSTRIFDVFLLEGDSFLFRVSLALLQILEPRLFNPVLSELADVFRGKDRGAVLVVKRENGWTTDEDVPAHLVYEEMGCEEAAVFGKLAALDWKEETWDRLVARELPEAD